MSGAHKRETSNATATRSSASFSVTIDSMEVNTAGRPIFWAATVEPGSPSEAALAQLAEWAAPPPS